MTDTHAFDDATVLIRLDDDTLRGSTSTAYANIAGPFGGVTAATMLRSVLENAERSGDPVALTVNFCGAVREGDFDISVKMQRTGKYTQHWSMELAQEGVILTTASVVCGQRSDGFSHQSGLMPSAPAPATCERLATTGRMNWLECYDFRFVEGAPVYSPEPFAEPAGSRSVMWVSDHPERPLDYLSLAALSDTFFLRLLHVRGTLVPMGTVSLTTYFHATSDELSAQSSAPLLGVAQGSRFHANFHDQQMELWGENGRPLATGTQVVWFKE